MSHPEPRSDRIRVGLMGAFMALAGLGLCALGAFLAFILGGLVHGGRGLFGPEVGVFMAIAGIVLFFVGLKWLVRGRAAPENRDPN